MKHEAGRTVTSPTRTTFGVILLGPDDSIAALNRRAQQRFVIRAVTPESAQLQQYTRTFLDTFDWRLYAAGIVCVVDDGSLQIYGFPATGARPRRSPGERARADGTPTETAHSERCDGASLRKRLPASVSALGSELLSRAAAKAAKGRALIPVFTTEVSRYLYRVTDENEKTIASLELDEPADDATPRFAWLYPWRGFSRECGELLAELPPGSEVVGIETYGRIMLGAGGREPGLYSSAVRLRIDPEQQLARVTKHVLGYFLDVMAENEQGIIDRVDTEFLHDYRVALRRLRSYVSQAKGSLPDDRVRELKADLKRISGPTGPARDLDVLLLHESEYHAILPDELQNGLEVYFAEIRRRREKAYDELAGFLSGAEYQELFEKWRSYAAAPGTEPALNGEVPVGTLAPRWISRRMEKLTRNVQGTNDATSDEQLHRMRIDGKKLRYLLEIFESLYPQGSVKALAKELKRFQDALGDLNDLSVQEAALSRDIAFFEKQGVGDIAPGAAIGGLLTRLEDRRPALYAAFERASRRYCKRLRTDAVIRITKRYGPKKEDAGP
jgi:CHAD domain-containing protein